MGPNELKTIENKQIFLVLPSVIHTLTPSVAKVDCVQLWHVPRATLRHHQAEQGVRLGATAILQLNRGTEHSKAASHSHTTT